MSNNYTVIIQARTGSTRLPEKVLIKVEGKTILEHVVTRVQAAKQVSQVIVATTVDIADLKIVKWCALNNVSVYCGSINDVLDRYYQTAQLFKVSNIIRITSDCPFIDPHLIDIMITFHHKQKKDYTANILKETFPDGEDIEIFTFAALKKAWQEGQLPSEREHVTPYIKNHNELFSLANYAASENLSHLRWTLDEPTDLFFIKKVYKRLYKRDHAFGMDAIIELLKVEPQLSTINTSITRNEGLKKSLKEDTYFLKQKKYGKRPKTLSRS